MKKYLSLLLMCLFAITITGQNTIKTKTDNIQSFLYQYSLYDKKADCKLWVNKAECQIEIGYTKFSLNDIKLSYRFHEQDRVHLVGFMCKEYQNCIEMSNPISGVSFGNGYYIGFKSKNSCYTFIDLIGDLRNSINKINSY
jgi:hypothetical protein